MAIEARCGWTRAHTHTRAHAHASMVPSIGWLPLRRVETSLHRFRVEAARSLDFYSISFHLSLLPPSFIPITAPTTLAFAFPLSRDRLSTREEKECFLRDADSPLGRGGIEFCCLDITVERWFARANPFTTITIAVGNRHARTKGNSNKSKTRSRPILRTNDGWLMHTVPS